MVDIIVAVVDDFGLDDGDDAGSLAFGGVFGEDVAVLGDGVGGGSNNIALVVEADFEGGAPFGEAKAHLVVFAQACGEIIEAFGPGFVGVDGGAGR